MFGLFVLHVFNVYVVDIAGVIGPELSSEVQDVSRFFSSLPPSDRLLQLNPTATAAALVNPNRYRNLFHFIPNDSVQVEVSHIHEHIAAILLRLPITPPSLP